MTLQFIQIILLTPNQPLIQLSHRYLHKIRDTSTRQRVQLVWVLENVKKKISLKIETKSNKLSQRT